MGRSIAELTEEEFRDMLKAAIEQKLLELLGDPDEGLEIRESVGERLLRQRKKVADGDLGRPLEEVVHELDLE